jgi:hypothetical protein
MRILETKSVAVIEALVIHIQPIRLIPLLQQFTSDKNINGIHLVLPLLKRREARETILDFFTLPCPNMKSRVEVLYVMNYMRCYHKYKNMWISLDSYEKDILSSDHLDYIITTLCQINFPNLRFILKCVQRVPSIATGRFIVSRCKHERLEEMKDIMREVFHFDNWLILFGILLKKFPWVGTKDAYLIKMSQHCHQNPIEILRICSTMFHTNLEHVLNIITLVMQGSIWNQELYIIITDMICTILDGLQERHFVHFLDIMRNLLGKKITSYPPLVKIYRLLNFERFRSISHKIVFDFVKAYRKKKHDEIRTSVLPLLQFLDVQMLHSRLWDDVEKGILKEMEIDFRENRTKFIKI